MPDGGGERIGDIVRDAPRHEHTKSHRNQDDDGKELNRTHIAHIVCLKELLALKHIVRCEHRHIA